MQEAAGYLGIAYYTLKDNYRAWGIPYIPVGRLIKFRERDLAAWLETVFSSKWFLTRQKNHHELRKIILRAELAKQGMDPEYLKIIEKKAFDER
jgi:excisionase family DNA binding protein